MASARRVTGPGRVNLIGDHTDYNQGLALPLAIDLGTTVEFTPTEARQLLFFSTLAPRGVSLRRDIPLDSAVLTSMEPPWTRPIAAMIALARPERGGVARIETTLPIGAGLSSSAALMVALAELLGIEGSALTIARLCRQAETFAGVPVGLMDPLVCAGGRAGHAMLVDFARSAFDHVSLPAEVEIVIVDSGTRRDLRDGRYAARVAECDAAAAVIGPLGLAAADDIAGLRDPLLERRARHVVSECERVRQMAEALESDEPEVAGRIMVESHRSLAGDFEVSTPTLDELVERLTALDGVYGARSTGAGFGGCVVALARPGAVDLAAFPTPAWRVRSVDGTAAHRGADGSALTPNAGPVQAVGSSG